MPMLTVHEAGPGLTIQDLGRPGWTAEGLSTGGAVDRLALLEAAALLDRGPEAAAIEMMGIGGVFTVDEPTRLALSGAEMRADINGVSIPFGVSFQLNADDRLTVGAALKGGYGYLSLAAGLATPETLGSRSAHLTAGIGRHLKAGDVLPFAPDPASAAPPMFLTPEPRFDGGAIRVIPGPQTHLFDAETLARFERTKFNASPKSNRQGVGLAYGTRRFSAFSGLKAVSDIIIPGDIQIAGDGTPYILLAECQTIGGYPRIGTVLPADLPKIAQATNGTEFTFCFVTLEEAEATARTDAVLLAQLRKSCRLLVRDPHDMTDLLSYQLISGAVRGDED